MPKDKTFLTVLLSLVFTQGIFEMLGVFSLTITRLIIETIILLFFIKIVFRKDRIIFPSFLLYMGFVCICLASGLANDKTFLEILMFFRRYGFLYLFLVAVINSRLGYKDKNKIEKLIIIFFILQVPVTIIKYISLGVTEQVVIGTINPTLGSLPAIYPMAVISVSFSFFLYKKLSVFQLASIIAASIFFGFAGAKRATVPYAIVGLLLTTFIFLLKEKYVLHFLKFIPILAFVGCAVLYFGLRLTPDLNPQNKVWGKFDVNHAIEYYDRYSNRSIGGAEGSGRINAIGASFRLLVADKIQLFFGKGAGDLIMSSFSRFEKDPGENFKYNLGYGIRTGFLQVLLQVGILGSLFLFSIYYRILVKQFESYFRSKDKKQSAHILAAIGLTTTFIIDTFSYSDIAIASLAFYIPFAILIGFNYRYIICSENLG